ncbi:hypothetical protein Gotur_000213 [Gossypium turneri]
MPSEVDKEGYEFRFGLGFKFTGVSTSVKADTVGLVPMVHNVKDALEGLMNLRKSYGLWDKIKVFLGWSVEILMKSCSLLKRKDHGSPKKGVILWTIRSWKERTIMWSVQTFRFEAWWVLKESCEWEIKRLWEGSEGTIPQRLTMLCHGLQVWTAGLEELNLEIDKSELFWEQRICANWLKLGDCNKGFFHRFSSHRRRVNRTVAYECVALVAQFKLNPLSMSFGTIRQYAVYGLTYTSHGLVSYQAPISKVEFYLLELDAVKENLPGCPIGAECWRPPERCCLKINFDTAYNALSRTSYIGLVIRDNQGLVLGSKSETHIHIPSLFTADTVACLQAVSLGFIWVLRRETQLHICWLKRDFEEGVHCFCVGGCLTLCGWLWNAIAIPWGCRVIRDKLKDLNWFGFFFIAWGAFLRRASATISGFILLLLMA